MRYPFIPTRGMTKKKKKRNETVGVDVEKFEPSYIAGGSGDGAAATENSWTASQKGKHKITV